MPATKILLVEDDPNLGQLLREYLELKGFDATLAVNGHDGLNTFLDGHFDLCLLDVMMPKKDGFTLAKEIKMKDADIPIIFLTAKTMKDDVMQGFSVGADDYINKPFSMDELLMRIHAILRRINKFLPDQKELYAIGAYQFDPHVQVLSHPEIQVKLTSKESDLLKLLCQNINKPVSRSVALKIIWGDDSYFNARSMDVYITKLRKLLRFDACIQIMNLHGEGFKLIV